MRKLPLFMIMALMVSIISVEGTQWTRIEEGDYWVYVPAENSNNTFSFNVTDTMISDLVFYNWVETDCDPRYLIPLNRSLKAEADGISQEVSVTFTGLDAPEGNIQCTSVANVLVFLEMEATLELDITGDLYNYSTTLVGDIHLTRHSGNLYQTIATTGECKDQYQIIFSTTDYFLELTFDLLCSASNPYEVKYGSKTYEVRDIVTREETWSVMDGRLTRTPNGTIISNDPWYFRMGAKGLIAISGHSPNPENPDSEINFDVTKSIGFVYEKVRQFSGDVGLPLNVMWTKKVLQWNSVSSNLTTNKRISGKKIIEEQDSYSMRLIEASIQNWGRFQLDKDVQSDKDVQFGSIIIFIQSFTIIYFIRRKRKKRKI